MSSAAQDEFRALINNNEKAGSPERNSPSPDDPGSEHNSDTHPDPNPRAASNNMPSGAANTHIPNTVYDANTGPKGVIADAQAFERARKTSFRKTLLNAAGFSLSPPQPQPQVRKERSPSSGKEDDDGDDEFMRKWRESRMRALQDTAASNSARRPSPRRRVYGSVQDVDAGGYLDAIEKVPRDTVVVVCIYDPESNSSAKVEDALDGLAPKYPLVRFVKLHHEIAEMDHIHPPALLAYRGAEVFATLVDLLSSMPNGRSCSAESLGDLLKAHRVL